MDTRTVALPWGVKRAAQVMKGKFKVTDLRSTAIVAECWVSDDAQNIGSRVEYWVFHDGYGANSEPGASHPSVQFKIDHTPFSPDIGDDDRQVWTDFLVYIATITPAYELWLRSVCVVSPQGPP